MRTAALVTAFVVLAGVFCKPAVPGPKWPRESTGTLTEAEVAQFIKLVPTLNAALKAGNWTSPPSKATPRPNPSACLPWLRVRATLLNIA